MVCGTWLADSWVCLECIPKQIRYCFWGYPPKDSGKTSGFYCGYCCRIFQHEHRGRLKSIDNYKAELGADKQKLDEHQSKVTVVIAQCIEVGGCVHLCKLDWSIVRELTLEVISFQSVEVEHPGWQHYEFHYYMKENNYELKPEHIRGLFKGVDGVWVKDPDVRKVKFSEKLTAALRRQLTASSAEDAQSLQADCMNSIAQEALGFRGNSFQRPVAGSFLDGSGIELPTDTPDSKSKTKAAASPEASPRTTASPPATQSSPGAVPGTPRHGLSFGPAPFGPSPAPSFGPAPRSVQAPTPSGEEKPKAKPKVKIEPGQDKPKPNKNPQQAGAKRGPGRPPANPLVETDKHVKLFVESTADSPTWFGAEVKTQMKKFEGLKASVDSMIAKSTDLAELPGLQVISKKLSYMHALMESGSVHGVGSESFCVVYDSQKTWCELDPAAPFLCPGWLHWARHKARINAIKDAKEWLSAIDRRQLESMGVQGIGSEQAVLLSERNAMYSKQQSQEQVIIKLKTLYNHDMDYTFTDEINEFAAGLTFLLDQSVITDLDERIEYFEEVISSWEAAENGAKDFSVECTSVSGISSVQCPSVRYIVYP